MGHEARARREDRQIAPRSRMHLQLVRLDISRSSSSLIFSSAAFGASAVLDAGDLPVAPVLQRLGRGRVMPVAVDDHGHWIGTRVSPSVRSAGKVGEGARARVAGDRPRVARRFWSVQTPGRAGRPPRRDHDAEVGPAVPLCRRTGSRSSSVGPAEANAGSGSSPNCVRRPANRLSGVRPAPLQVRRMGEEYLPRRASPRQRVDAGRAFVRAQRSDASPTPKPTPARRGGPIFRLPRASSRRPRCAQTGFTETSMIWVRLPVVADLMAVAGERPGEIVRRTDRPPNSCPRGRVRLVCVPLLTLSPPSSVPNVRWSRAPYGPKHRRNRAGRSCRLQRARRRFRRTTMSPSATPKLSRIRVPFAPAAEIDVIVGLGGEFDRTRAVDLGDAHRRRPRPWPRSSCRRWRSAPRHCIWLCRLSSRRPSRIGSFRRC